MSTSVVLVGGGLANCLVALRLKALRPDIRLTLLEGSGTLGGNHTWSFHSTDVSPAVLDWLQPLAACSWPYYDVRFPGRKRRLHGGYHSLTAEKLNSVVMTKLGDSVRLHSPVLQVRADRITLAGGEEVSGDLVVDGRGPQPLAPASTQTGLTLRFQKFLGQLVRLAAPHGLAGPVLMDAAVAQEHGYRFVYLLPFTATEILIEDTYYSDTVDIDSAALRQNIARYAADRGWQVQALLREESGVLPIVLDCDLDAFWPVADAVPRSGLRAGLFHHTTGYSLPDAAALAHDLPGQGRLESAILLPWFRERVQRRWGEQRLFRFLNRMLFLATPPADRYRILQHFYRLPESVIDHFYGGCLTVGDALRVLTGSPPIPIRRALRYLLPSSSRS